VTRSIYGTGTNIPNIVIGSALPGGGTAVNDGTYPNVFNNETPDASFGVTSSIYLDEMNPNTPNAVNARNITAMAAAQGMNLATSFPSKSELALNVSSDRKSLTFMAYNALTNQLDISNTDTPDVADSSNPVTVGGIAHATYRTATQIYFADSSMSFTNTSGYSGNNGRAVVLNNNQFYMVGNAGNSGKPKPTGIVLSNLSDDTGVQTIGLNSISPLTTAVGVVQGIFGNATGYQHGFSITSVIDPATGVAAVADKTGKDANFRGLTVGPDGTMYVSKGSGGNGVNTVYQVGANGALANGAQLNPATSTITIAPGFSTTPASAATGVIYPFGIWLPTPTTMFVADEGDGVIGNATKSSGGLYEYTFANGKWTQVASFTTGLNLGVAYTVADIGKNYGAGGTAAASYSTAADGLRNITGKVNADGSYTIYAVTSTIAPAAGAGLNDPGAEANQLVAINVKGTTSAAGFSLLRTAPYGQVLRGVAIVPTAP